MNKQPIQNLIKEYRELDNHLRAAGQISYAINISPHYKKILLLSCSSLYEKFFTDEIKKIITQKTSHEALSYLFYNKSIKQQYFKFFDWKEDGGDIKNFLRLFGPNVQSKIQSEIDSSPELKSGMNSFLKIGHNRNLLVHENFLIYSLEKTFEEIEDLHNKASRFLEYLMSALERYI